MSKKLKKKRKDLDLEDEDIDEKPLVREEAMRVIYALGFFIVAIFLILSSSYIEKAGPVGTAVFTLLHSLLGVGYYLLPIMLILIAIIFLRSLRQSVPWPKLVSAFLFFISALGIISIISRSSTSTGDGGFIGNIIASPLLNLFDFWVSLLFLIGLLIVATVIILDNHIDQDTILFWRRWSKKEEDLDDVEIDIPADAVETPKKLEPVKAEVAEDEQSRSGLKKMLGLSQEKPEDEGFDMSMSRLTGKVYNPPPISLLEQDKGKPGVGDIKANANIIKRTLLNFGINVEMDEISIGPSVTRYALKPAEGMKLSRILGLQNDLSLALAAHPIRIEAPIPGKSLVGIEIPNSTKTTVGLGTLFASDEFRQSDKPLLVSLGKAISGKSIFANLGKMPHLLIAGATGSGKSVTIHTVLTSLLYRNSPENLKFIMIDPKRVELTMYNKIPHLLTPVITDAKKAILALKWAGKEMDRRYDILEASKVRDVESYHKNILAPAVKKLERDGGVIEGEDMPEAMPYIVVIIDELADLMQAYPRELESSIVRLAQMSRAVGIHLIISTQRPSVNVITGLIKANVPSRIALQVTSQIDSRTILDMAGAEKLLGAGDMLFMSGDMAKPQRIQSAYISETELKNVVKYLIDNYADELPSEINLTENSVGEKSIFSSSFGDDSSDDEDDLYEEAREIVVAAGKASTSYLQRKLRVGYARAARLVDMLEERGVIGPGDGAKPREVIGAAGSSDVAITDDNPENNI